MYVLTLNHSLPLVRTVSAPHSRGSTNDVLCSEALHSMDFRLDWATVDHSDAASRARFRLLSRDNRDFLSSCYDVFGNTSRRMLQGRHILLMGDSVTRYMYLSLAHYLTHGHWPDPIINSGEQNVCWEGTHSSWPTFYEYTNAKLNVGNSTEFCDCYRSGISSEYPYNVSENRFFAIADEDIRLSYVQFFTPTLQVHGHFTDPASSNDENERIFSAAGDYAYETNLSTFYSEILPNWKHVPDTVILNSGLWEGLWPNVADPDDYYADVLRATESGTESSGRTKYVWRTTTASRFIRSNIADTADSFMLKNGANAGWKILDIDRVTQQLKSDFFTLNFFLYEQNKSQENIELMNFPFLDGVHYQPFVYELLNKLLLLFLTSE